MNFPENLKRLRKGKKVSQEQLARALGVRQWKIGNWETGIREPKLKDLPRIAEIFGVGVEELVK